MEEAELAEYEAKEEEISKLLTEKAESKRQGVSVLDFYPEWKLTGSYCNDASEDLRMWKPHLQKPLQILLPFHHHVLFAVGLVKNESAFEKMYGISVAQLLQLEEERRIILRLGLPPTAYKNLDYLDPILEKHYPTGVRRISFDRFVLGANYNRMEAAADQIFDSLDKTSEINPFWLDFYDQLPLLYKQTRIGWYRGLGREGFESALESIHTTAKVDVSKAADELWVLYACLGNRAFDGINTVLKSTLTQSISDYTKRFTSFPLDVGKLLVRDLKLVDTRKVGGEEIIDVTKKSPEKARRALFELDKAVSDRSERINERTEDLREALAEANQAIQSMTSLRAKLKKTISITLGVSGAIVGGLGGFPNLLSGTMIGIGASTLIAEPTAEKIVRFRKKSHVLALYDLASSSTS